MNEFLISLTILSYMRRRNTESQILHKSSLSLSEIGRMKNLTDIFLS